MRDFNTQLSTIDSSSKQKTQYGNFGLAIYFITNRPNRHTQNILSNNNKIRILLNCTGNILQDRSYVRSQTSPSNFKKTKSIPNVFSDHKEMKLERNTGEKWENLHLQGFVK